MTLPGKSLTVSGLPSRKTSNLLGAPLRPPLTPLGGMMLRSESTESRASGHVTSTLREWKRRDWGDGGHDFHWWCTDSDDAFIGAAPVYEELGGELSAMVGEEVFAMIEVHLRDRTRRQGTQVFLPHPALRQD